VLFGGAVLKKGSASSRSSSQQPLEQFTGDLAARGPAPLVIVRFALLVSDPYIQKRIPRSRIKTQNRCLRVCRKQANVSDPTDVHDRPCSAGRAKHEVVEGRHEWRAVPAGGDIARAKIGDCGDARPFGNHGSVAQLQGKRMVSSRVMGNGLPMAADGVHVLRTDARLREQRIGRLREGLADRRIELAERLHCSGPVLGGAATVPQGLDGAPHRSGVSDVGGRMQRRRALLRE